MSRSGYTEDYDSNWQMIMWRGAVTSAIKGKRGQAFLKEMLTNIDALPEKKLIAHELINNKGEVCAIGAVAKARGLDVSKVDPEDRESVAELFNIPFSLVAEIAYMNDESEGQCYWNEKAISPQDRFASVRRWIVSKIKE